MITVAPCVSGDSQACLAIPQGEAWSANPAAEYRVNSNGITFQLPRGEEDDLFQQSSVTAHTAEDFRLRAKRRLPRFLFDYFDGGSFAEATLRHNVSDLYEVMLRQRVMTEVSTVETGIEMFGAKWSMPVALSPIGMAGLANRRGEVQAARAAEVANVPFCLSTVSACALNEVRAGTIKPFWFQAYMAKDRDFMRRVLAEAEESNCSALLFTVDLPVSGPRYRDTRSGLNVARGLAGPARRAVQALARPHWLYNVGLRGRPHTLGNVAPMLAPGAGIGDFLSWMGANFDPTVGWKDVAWIRDRWHRPLIVKGILDVEDARAAVGTGVDGIIVSNHGGRQLDGVMSSVRALPAIVDAVQTRLPVLVDGGVRSGVDVLRMLALGASAVMIGRPWAFALGADGERGVTALLANIHRELVVAMTLTGCPNIASIDDRVLAMSKSASSE